MYQLSFAKAVANNCSTKIIYNSSGEEAEATAKDWLYTDKTKYLAAEQITDLPRYTFYCRTFKHNAPSVKRVTAFRSAKPRFKIIRHAKTYKRSREAEPESLKAESLMRYSRDKKKTLAQIHNTMR